MPKLRRGPECCATVRIRWQPAGERQRVAIAMALSTGPGLVLADEPTGSRDSRGGRIVLSLLAEVCRERGTATLIMTHDPLATSVADRAWGTTGGWSTMRPTACRHQGRQADRLICCVDGLKGYSEAIEAIFPDTTV